MTARPFRKVRKLRHWKQRYKPGAKFIFRRRTLYAGVIYEAGDMIPEALAKSKAKLRRFWEAKRIELAQFEDPAENVNVSGQTKDSDNEMPAGTDGDGGGIDGPEGPDGVAGETDPPETETDTPKNEPEQPESETKTASGETEPEIEVDYLGAGWYRIGGKKGEKVRGRKAVDARLAELRSGGQ